MSHDVFESEFERSLYSLRQEKLKQLDGLGQKAYPNTFAPPADHPLTAIPKIRAQYDTWIGEQFEATRVPIAVAGRIMAIRQQGKAGFATLQQDGARLQIYVRKDAVGDQAFELYKLLDLGDHIGVTGYLFRTRTNELTIHVETITFLAKALLALPEKYHGLSDIELRYRQRYVDLFMNGVLNEAPAEGATEAQKAEEIHVRDVFVKRAAVLRAMRRFFDARGYIEVETPMMQPIAGGAAAKPFMTHHNTLDMDLFLRIAPELYLKRLVVGGFDRVYEINRNFRNEGISTQHNPEFTMLEFYQAYANYKDLIELTKELIVYVAKEVNGTTVTHFNGVEIDLAKWRTFTMREAIIEFWPEAVGPKPTAADFESEEAVARLSERAGTVHFIERKPDEPRGKTIASIFEAVAEEHLIQPTIIYEFPTVVSPLSKQKPDEPDWVERFEFYIGGFELGNAFSELNDPEEQFRRFKDQLEQHERGDEEAHQLDVDYVRALAYGLPPTAGEGIGIDRLTMILTGARSIRDVILFPLLRPQAKEPEAGGGKQESPN
ncbi:MAG TPA: lysine--tRNA ligase [Acidobacteriaceae bacterium]|nr:lysine--tRNA ligase [Acidobacteriaceae bacterium]